METFVGHSVAIASEAVAMVIFLGGFEGLSMAEGKMGRLRLEEKLISGLAAVVTGVVVGIAFT